MSEIPEFIEMIKNRDKDFAEGAVECMNRALESRALSRKNKILMMLALDASAEHTQGVEELAGMAMAEGATEDEIVETLEIVAVSKFMQGLETGVMGALK